MKDSSRPPSKSKRGSSQISSLTVLIVGIVLLVVVGYICKMNSTPSTFSSPKVDLSEYERLLNRAKELTTKYKDLTGGTILPEELQQRYAVKAAATTGDAAVIPSTAVLPIGTSITANAKAKATATRDLVLGMAQDTDPKNLVSFVCVQ